MHLYSLPVLPLLRHQPIPQAPHREDHQCNSTSTQEHTYSAQISLRNAEQHTDEKTTRNTPFAQMFNGCVVKAFLLCSTNEENVQTGPIINFSVLHQLIEKRIKQDKLFLEKRKKNENCK